MFETFTDHFLFQFAVHRKETLYKRDPIVCQERLLRDLVKHNRHTNFGIQHHFETINSGRQFLRHVSPHTYDNYLPWIKYIMKGKDNILFSGRPVCFGTTTGTENQPKLIPLNKTILNSTRWSAIDAALLGSIDHTSGSWRHGKTLYIGPRKSHCIDQWQVFSEGTAFVYLQLNPFTTRFVPKYEDLPQSNEKSDYALLVQCLSRYRITAVAGNPLEIVDFVKTTQTILPEVHIVFNCGYWAVDLIDTYKTAFPNATIVDVYSSNEGTWGLPISPGRFLLNYRRVFFSFLPLNTDVEALPLENLTIGQKYRICVTTPGGLWNYVTGDVVYAESIRPPVFILCGRVNRILPLGDGWLTEDEVVHAIRGLKLKIADYYLSPKENGYVLYVAGELPSEEMVDQNIRQLNLSYHKQRTLGKLNRIRVYSTKKIHRNSSKPARIHVTTGSKGDMYEADLLSDKNEHMS